MVFYLYISSHILDTVLKEFLERDQQIKTILDNSLQQQKYLSHPFFYCIKEWKTQFSRFITQMISSYWTV